MATSELPKTSINKTRLKVGRAALVNGLRVGRGMSLVSRNPILKVDKLSISKNVNWVYITPVQKENVLTSIFN